MPSIGAPELLVIVVLALIIFGPRRLPEIGRTVGKSLREFRRAASEIRAELEAGTDEGAPATPVSPNARATRTRGARRAPAARPSARPAPEPPAAPVQGDGAPD